MFGDANITITPITNLGELLDNARPELDAIAIDELVARKVTRERVLELTATLRSSWTELEPRLDAELHPDRAALRKQQLATLPDRARVFYAADLQANELHANALRAERDALAQRVAAFDRTLMKWAVPLFGDDPAAADILADISRGTGRRDDAEDILRLVKLYRDAWETIAGSTPVDAATLDEAEAAAIAQLELLAPTRTNPARELAVRAYSAWHHDYNQLRALGLYLCWDQADAVQRFPGIRGLATRRADTDRDDADDDEADLDELDDEAEAEGAPIEPSDAPLVEVESA